MKTLSSPPRPATVALIGNPNTGKSTLFNALCGMRQRVANYPGVTVEKKIGRAQLHGQPFRVVDLPGSYSLSPRSPDEMIAVDVLLGRRGDVARPDLVVCILDASNLERNLYLAGQVLEIGLPVVLALNMVDVAKKRGIRVDAQTLSARLGVPVIPIQAHRKLGLDDLRTAIIQAAGSSPQAPPSPFPESFQQEVASLLGKLPGNGHPSLPRFLVERLLLDTSGYLTSTALRGVSSELLGEVVAARRRLTERGISIPTMEPTVRYRWVGEIARHSVSRVEVPKGTCGDALDRILTHRLWGSLVFALVMMLLFQSVFYLAEPASACIDRLNHVATDFVASRLSEGALQSLLINGVIEGVGGVLAFLPQILVLFLFVACLEDCGYMARAAHLMDKLMTQIGLSGKSFIPLLSSFACAIPGIMSARVIENPKDRLITILIAPLMSCSARLPVYTLLIGAFIPDTHFLGGLVGLQGLIMLALYLLGIAAAVLVAMILRRVVFRGPVPPFIMELPSYKLPGFSLVVHRILERGWDFVQRAGTLILAVTILVWAAGYYPRSIGPDHAALLSQQAAVEQQVARLEHSTDADPELQLALRARLAGIQSEIDGVRLRGSFLGQLGRCIEPAVKPLGWDWRIGCAVIASLPAREVVIASLAVIYNLADDDTHRSDTLRATLQAATWDGSTRAVFNPPVALSIMVFFALCAQCAPTLAVIRRETNSCWWPVFTFVYMSVLAYLGALVAYQAGMAILS